MFPAIRFRIIVGHIYHRLIANIAKIFLASYASYLIISAFFNVYFGAIFVRAHSCEFQIYPRNIFICFLRYYVLVYFNR